MENKIDEKYIQAILNLYKEVTQEQERMELKFRTRMMQYIKNDFINGKITEETFNKVEEELAWAMVNDDANLGRKREEIFKNQLENDDESNETKNSNERETFRKKLHFPQKDIEARTQIKGQFQYTQEEIREQKEKELEEWKKKAKEFDEKLQVKNIYNYKNSQQTQEANEENDREEK